MSHLLEQAIIDAEALKEAATKSAQNALIEKHSKELKESIEKLLEMETLPQDPNNELDPSLGMDPNAMPEQNTPTDLGGADASNKLEGVPSAFLKDDDSLVEINFDELEEKEENFGMRDTSDISTQDDMLDFDPSGLESDAMPNDQGVDMHNVGSGTDNVGTQNFADSKPGQPPMMEELDLDVEDEADEVIKEVEEETEKEELKEQEEIEEELIEQLVEEMIVDISTSPSGNMLDSQSEKNKEADVLAARMRDNQVQKELEVEKERVSNLLEAVKKSEKTIRKLQEERKELFGMVNTLKETVTKTNLSNAKLLFTNKVLVNTSLNERQKEALVEAITKTKSVEQTKLIYETLQSTVQTTSKHELPKSLSEALNRNQTPFARTGNGSSLTSPEVKRNQILAGIIKS